MIARTLATLALAQLAAAQIPAHALLTDQVTPTTDASVSGFGQTIDVDGDQMVAGAPAHDSNLGAVFVFQRQAGSWSESALLLAPNMTSPGRLGWDVDISGNTIVAGSPYELVSPGEYGAAHVWSKVGGQWQQEATLLPSTHGGGQFSFGLSVAIDGDRILVSRPADSTLSTWSGAVYAYEHTGSGWNEIAILYPTFQGAYFGESLAIDGDRAVIGASGTGVGGSAYVYQWSGSTWMFDGWLSESSALGGSYGQSVDIEGDRVVVGATRWDGAALWSGCAFLYERGPGGWALAQQVYSLDGETDDYFGYDVDLQGNQLLVSSTGTDEPHIYDSGAAYLFQEQAGTWDEIAKIQGGHIPNYGFVDVNAAVSFAGQEVLLSAGPVGSQVGLLRSPLPLVPVADLYCGGDASGSPCPCLNQSADRAGEGCRNSTSFGGHLIAGGSGSLSSDDLYIVASQLPNETPGLLVTGNMQASGGQGTPFGDGLLCVGGSIVRLGAQPVSALTGALWGPGVLASTPYQPGDTGYFQVWYRDPLASCGANFNLTNALSIVFEP